MMQAARPDAISAAFVFLYLLKGKAEGFAKLFLTHAEHRPALPDTTADMNVYGLGSAPGADGGCALFLCLFWLVHNVFVFSRIAGRQRHVPRESTCSPRAYLTTD